MDKKAFLKTLEATIAIIIMLGFLVVLLPRITEKETAIPADISLVQEKVLREIEFNNTLRNEILSGSNPDASSYPITFNFINSTIPPTLDFTISVCIDSSCPIPPLPEKTVYAKNLIVASTLTIYDQRLFRLFIRRK